MPGKKLRPIMAAALALALGGGMAQASSHCDAPLIKMDPQANLTDVYTFIGTNATGTQVLNVLVAVRPFCEPGDGPFYDRFSHNAQYSINITDPATGATVIRYDFQFSPVSSAAGNYKNKNTILAYGRGADVNGQPDVGAIQNVGDNHQNYTQTYTVTKTATVNGSTTTTTLTSSASPPLVPPANPGRRVTPNYNSSTTGFATNFYTAATTAASLDTYTKETVYSLGTGETIFAGLREDGFFADVPGIFDLLNPRILGTSGNGQDPCPYSNQNTGTKGNGFDGFKGYNTLAYAIQIPVSQLPSGLKYPSNYPALLGGPTQTGVGVYASVSRPRLRLLSTTSDPESGGPYIQVNRLANPLFNEALVAIVDKDNYNRSSPTNDAANFTKYASSPELIVLLNAVFNKSFTTTGRTDLVAIYIPDVIRVNTGTGSVPLPGQTGFNRLSAFGGDTVKDSSGNTVPGGWPNGRRVGDDVVDIALTAIASGPGYSAINVLGDNIPCNDQLFNTVFPYLATPNSGTHNSKDSGTNVGGP